MDLADFIRLASHEPPLPFLIIGGYAVAAHGHTRATFDVDFLARRAQRDLWKARLTESGLRLFGETPAFAQYSQSEGGDGLDLMWVDEPTFDRMWQASEDRDFGGCQGRVPCLEHLLALKLHALKQAALPHRTSKDAEDVEILVRRHELNLRDRRYEKLFLKYGIEKFTKPSSACSEIRGALPPSLDLNLPDGETVRFLPPLVSLAAMRKRIQELRVWFPSGLPRDEERWATKSHVEFHL